ncbi:hypothetical protein RB201_18260 [Streptomyces sp. S1A(2023)]
MADYDVPSHRVAAVKVLGAPWGLAGGELAGGRDAVPGKPAPLLDQCEGGGGFVLAERCPDVCSV